MMDSFSVAVGVVVGLGALYLYTVYLRFTRGVCHSKADLSGKTAIITGASGGSSYTHTYIIY